MRTDLRISSLVPSGLVVESVSDLAELYYFGRAIRSIDGRNAHCAEWPRAESITDTSDKSQTCHVRAGQYASR